MSRLSFWHTVGLHRIPCMTHTKEGQYNIHLSPSTVLTTSKINNDTGGAKPWQPQIHVNMWLQMFISFSINTQNYLIKDVNKVCIERHLKCWPIPHWTDLSDAGNLIDGGLSSLHTLGFWGTLTVCRSSISYALRWRKNQSVKTQRSIEGLHKSEIMLTQKCNSMHLSRL